MNLVLLKAPGIPLKNLVSKYCCENGNIGITDNSEKTLRNLNEMLQHLPPLTNFELEGLGNEKS